MRLFKHSPSPEVMGTHQAPLDQPMLLDNAVERLRDPQNWGNNIHPELTVDIDPVLQETVTHKPSVRIVTKVGAAGGVLLVLAGSPAVAHAETNAAHKTDSSLQVEVDNALDQAGSQVGPAIELDRSSKLLQQLQGSNGDGTNVPANALQPNIVPKPADLGFPIEVLTDLPELTTTPVNPVETPTTSPAKQNRKPKLETPKETIPPETSTTIKSETDTDAKLQDLLGSILSQPPAISLTAPATPNIQTTLPPEVVSEPPKPAIVIPEAYQKQCEEAHAGVEPNMPVYIKAAEITDIPEQVLAGIHFEEANNDPTRDLQAGNPLVTGGSQYSSLGAQPDLLTSAINAGKELQDKALSGVYHTRITRANPNADVIKDALYGYNGRAKAYASQAEELGFDKSQQPAEGSPYVVEGLTEKQTGLGLITHDFGGIDGKAKRPGVFTMAISLGLQTQSNNAPNSIPETAVTTSPVLDFRDLMSGKAADILIHDLVPNEYKPDNTASVTSTSKPASNPDIKNVTAAELALPRKQSTNTDIAEILDGAATFWKDSPIDNTTAPPSTEITVPPQFDLNHELINKDSVHNETNGVQTVVVRDIRIRVEAAMNLAEMLKAAEQDGVHLTSTPRGGFRNIEDQAALREENGCADIYNAPASACATPTAKPGESNHESKPDDPRSYAVDFGENGKQISSRNDRAYQWLQKHAAGYGFLPIIDNSEPWHWSGNRK